MNNILKAGLAYGLFSIVYSVLLLSVKPDWMFSGTSMIIAIILSLVVLIYIGRHFFRGNEDSFLSYGGAVKNLFIASLIGSLLSFVVITAIYSNNEGLKEKHLAFTIQAQEKAVRMTVGLTGGSEADKEEAVAQIREKIESGEIKQASYPYTWSMLPMNFAVGAIFNLVYCLIGARWVREKEEAQT